MLALLPRSATCHLGWGQTDLSLEGFFHVRDNSYLDIDLCKFVASIVGPSVTLGDFGAGVGKYLHIHIH
jgi:hypothetical protein